MPWGLTPAHLVILLIIVLVVVGPGKLPETGAAIGKALRGFKDAVDGSDNAQQNNAAAQGQPPVQPAPMVPPVQQTMQQQVP